MDFKKKFNVGLLKNALKSNDWKSADTWKYSYSFQIIFIPRCLEQLHFFILFIFFLSYFLLIISKLSHKHDQNLNILKFN